MLLVASAAWAQSRNITGIVFDTDGKSPLVGATVILKGTATGTISNADGTYDPCRQRQRRAGLPVAGL